MNEESPISLNFLKHPMVWVVTIARLLIALYIFINPFWGVLWSMVADWVDSQVLLHGVGITRPQYQLWDKNVDWFAYVVELSVASSFGLYLPFFLLLFWRFLGQFMFVRTHKRWMFVFFPNFFEMIFLWLVIFYPHGGLVSWPTGHTLTWLIVFIVGKQIHELLLHFIAPKYHFTDVTFQAHINRFFQLIFKR